MLIKSNNIELFVYLMSNVEYLPYGYQYLDILLARLRAPHIGHRPTQDIVTRKEVEDLPYQEPPPSRKLRDIITIFDELYTG